MEPPLSPPVDSKWEMVSRYVEELDVESLAYEIQSEIFDQRVKEKILELELPNANDFMKDVIYNANIFFLLKLVSKNTIGEIKEMLIDYLYWRD